MLELRNLCKDYFLDKTPIRVLNEVNYTFNKTEFVSILGESGSGKTTLLNLIGGLDRATSGSIVLDGVCTKDFTDSNWDYYRNTNIGFIFQNYNLIDHLTVLKNVELSLTLAGVDAKTRKDLAVKYLTEVGLKNHINKKPTQLSGGQKQRVCIARALVNQPSIILADEPTGALDSQTGLEVANLLKEISKTKLVIMVTHNNQLAKKYSDRIIAMKDGKATFKSVANKSSVESQNVAKEDKVSKSKKNADSKVETNQSVTTNEVDTQTNTDSKKTYNHKKTKLNIFTAMAMSYANLKTKLGRTLLSSVASSIGMIGVALVLFLSSGFGVALAQMEATFSSSVPMIISSGNVTLTSTYPEYQDLYDYYIDEDESSGFGSGLIFSSSNDADSVTHTNPTITEDYYNYTNGLNEDDYAWKVTQYGLFYRGIYKNNEDDYAIASAKSYTHIYQGTDIFNSHFNVLAGRLPQSTDEAVLVIDETSAVSTGVFSMLEVAENLNGNTYEDFVDKKYRLCDPQDFILYDEGMGLFYNLQNTTVLDDLGIYDSAFDHAYNNAHTTTVVGVIIQKEESSLTGISRGIYVSQEYIDVYADGMANNDYTKAQLQTNVDLHYIIDKNMEYGDVVFEGDTDAYYITRVTNFGCVKTYSKITIYPNSADSKDNISNYLLAYNTDLEVEQSYHYSYSVSKLLNNYSSTINSVSTMILAFSIIAMIISTVMIGIIIYTSVIERTREIGTLKSLGASKKDIGKLFNSESALIGLLAGTIAVVAASLLSVFGNYILNKELADIGNVIVPKVHLCLIVVALSVVLTLIASFIPSRIAAKKDAIKSLNA